MAPKRKIRSISEFSEEEAIEFINLLHEVRKGMKELSIDDVYLFQNEDTPHNFHLWIFSRHKLMEKFGRKIESVRSIMNYSKENMITDDVIKEVRMYVQKMKEYMKKF